MRDLLLVSTSKVHGTGYLDHCEEFVRELFAARRVLFVPYALKDQDAYARMAGERLGAMGLKSDSLHTQQDPRAALEQAQGVFIGGGNTFRLMKTLQDQDLVGILQRRCLAGMPYMGTSAGSNVACATIMTTNDMPIVQPESFAALGLVPFQINAHYLDPDPASTHMGETRATRIREFHEEQALPVVGLREGAMLRVSGDSLRLLGLKGARLFRRGIEPQEFLPGDHLDFLLTDA